MFRQGPRKFRGPYREHYENHCMPHRQKRKRSHQGMVKIHTVEHVLSSLTGIDEIVVVDTGSQDTTVEIAREFTDKVFTDYTWNDDFAEARNYARQKCEGDWILSIDGDEVLEEGGVEKIRKIVENALPDQLHFSVEMTAAGSGAKHNLPRIFRNDGSVSWLGIAHETLTPYQRNLTDVVITYGSSTAHALDPDRMLRILAKVVNSPGATPRDLYYYAREFYYRADYPQAMRLWKEYVAIATWMPEKTDALLYIARCQSLLGLNEEARKTCADAVLHNPMFREALLFLGDLHAPPWKEKWHKLAEAATNDDVLFKRI